ncbi:sarcosine oxidase subunit gamma family protein [Thalassospira sp. MA62]|nr:sarcosine oxidase subunit gamma family protein [Thalassospira sp. MA62]
MTVVTNAFKPGPLVSNNVVSLSIMEPVGRLSIRAKDGQVAALSKALGLELPRKIGTRVSGASGEVICLSPDEWQMVLPDAATKDVMAACEAIYADAPHSVTDISDREVSIMIEGSGAMELLSIGCPRDLDTLAVGDGCRTVIDGQTVVLWREGETQVRLDVWRSFAPHLFDLLITGCGELAAG